MVRTQIQITEEQAMTLKAMAQARQVSIAELIRTSIDLMVHREATSTREARVARAKAVAGRYASGSADGSAEHDRYLAEAFGEP
jgi:hypothetical protein